ncbi:MAG: hypothetical protein NZ890_10235 [Myxococcota bacterium]|nr:hypothetical protein [Myxococcota bacterium]
MMRLPFAPCIPLLVLLLGACRERARPVEAPPQPAFPPDAAVVVSLGEHDTLQGARQGLAAALKLRANLPLPFPRVERHGDLFRVVAARGKYAALEPLLGELGKSGGAHRVIPASQAGGDDVVRLAIVCTEGAAAPLYAPVLPESGLPAEIARLPHGEVLVPLEDEGGLEEDSPEAERGFIKVVAPQQGMVRGPDVLLPADCTPRDEDNDDGNGHLLGGGRLCLTTRFSGRDGDVARAALVAVAPNYRRCHRFPDAGTFDGFDQHPAGTQFAVEAIGSGGAGVSVYDVSAEGVLTLRFHVVGLTRPVYLGGSLVAVEETADRQALVVIGPEALQGPGSPTPRRIFSVGAAQFHPAVPTHRPAAPTLQDGRVTAVFHQACNRIEERRVRSVARGDFEQCVREMEVEVGLDASAPQTRCQLNNSPSGLDQPLRTSCP